MSLQAAAAEAKEQLRREAWMSALRLQITEAEAALKEERASPAAQLPTAVRSRPMSRVTSGLTSRVSFEKERPAAAEAEEAPVATEAAEATVSNMLDDTAEELSVSICIPLNSKDPIETRLKSLVDSAAI